MHVPSFNRLCHRAWAFKHSSDHVEQAAAWARRHARMQAGGLATDSDVCRVLLKAAMRCADAPRTEQGLALLRDAGLQARAL